MQQKTVQRAKDELETLSELSVQLSEKIREGRQSRGFRVIQDIQEADLANISDGLTKAFEEVALRGYGRVIFADEYDENGRFVGSTYYRVSQANAGFPDKPIQLVARNSPVGSRIASCAVGDEISIRAPKGERSLVVTGIIDISGMSKLLHENPDARKLLFRAEEGAPDEQIIGLRSFVTTLANRFEEGSGTHNSQGSAIEKQRPTGLAVDAAHQTLPIHPVNVGISSDSTILFAPVGTEQSVDVITMVQNEIIQHQNEADHKLHVVNEVQPTTESEDQFWGINDGSVIFGDDAEVSLAAQFFTQTTKNQEAGIQTVRGLQIVHGIAGSGKTSVALGRLKFFANFRSLENLPEYGLHERDFADFDAGNMIGFVLSPSLVSYLKQTAENLDMGAMKIQDFSEFLNKERTYRRVFNGRPFKRSPDSGHPEQKSVLWLKILDIVAAGYVAERMKEIADSDLAKPSVPGAENIAAVRWSKIVNEKWRTGPLAFRLRGLIRSLEPVPDLDLRTFVLRKVAVEIDRRVRLGENEASDLEMNERRILREAIENEQQRLFRLLNPQEMYVHIITDEKYRSRIEQLALRAGMAAADVILPIADRLSHNLVTDDDAICALCLNALSCDQFDRDMKAIPYLRSFAERIGVFIDEYQDFSELQVLLMGYKALPKYWLVTVSGDPSQRLHRDGLAEVQRAFPQIATRHASVMLDRNMRQTGPLAALSACFRSLTDEIEVVARDGCAAPLDVYEVPDAFAQIAVERILALPKTASVAVICANDQDVDRWYTLMERDLDAGFRNPMISDHSKLTMRFHTHFTTPIEAKGLEFDVVVVPDLAAFDSLDSVTRNSLYVAVSRPRHALLMGCDYNSIDSSIVASLVNDDHLILRTMERETPEVALLA